MTSEINANNITYLVDKYNPKDVNDIFIPEIEYNKEINIISEELNIEENSWKKSLPNKCYFHKEIYKKLNDESP